MKSEPDKYCRCKRTDFGSKMSDDVLKKDVDGDDLCPMCGKKVQRPMLRTDKKNEA